jgi:hypothetical protein
MLFTCALFFYPATAQKVSAVTDREKILIGEQIILQLKVEDVNDRNSFVQNWFTFNDATPHIQVVKKEPIDTIEINGLNTYLQKITITSFDSGRWAINPMPVELQDRITGKKTLLSSDSIFIEVLPVDVSAMTDYHPLKDIIAIEAKPDYMRYAIVAFIAIILAALIWLLIKQFSKKKLEPAKAIYKATALENALNKINLLQQGSLLANGKVKQFYTELSDIGREYFSRQSGIHASRITTDELMMSVMVYLQDEKRRTAFFQLLRMTDAVKFAKFIPGTVEHKEAIETAVNSLKHIDEMIKQSTQNDN